VTPDLSSLQRYRPLVEDWDAFRAALARPLPVTVWSNTPRARPAEVATWLAADGLEPEALGWRPGAFRLPPGIAPGALLATSAGLIHVQEEVSLLPVALLDPRPGERILDLCAAPGGKTAQIAVALGNRGTVVANDVDWRRLVTMGRTLQRLGLANVALTAWDGATFPETGGLYDRVLADVPCTCEGTSRKNPEVLTWDGAWGGEEERARTVRTQRAILTKAVRLCRPGGRIVYSTCTYAPEENEAVVDDVLRAAAPGGLRVVDARELGLVEGFRAAPGLDGWQGRSFDRSLVRALRVWPHVHDTGGFFVAVLERLGSPEREGRGERSAELHPLEEVEPAERRAYVAHLAERFDFPEGTFSDLVFARHGKEKLLALPRGFAAPARPAPHALGLPLLYADMRNPKLTTAAAMAFGARVRANVVDLDRPCLAGYLARRDVELSGEETRACTGDGYVLVRHRGACLGVGWFRPAPGGGSLRSLFPKRW
jgi:16S rRNA C967 or C1407 C5-methylase (RsmB/RsmF family)/NOL1/NOP2/fmu family ribosome biogenesis protein